ncbi:MAG: chemotaxis protein CheC [Peptococcaceae bacterium]|nr:chemotaxis protein CheC [Peptococcaceae bacterium]
MDKFSEMQVGALCEMGNIGAGNAATALSQLLGFKIDITVPHVRVVPIDSMEAWGDRGEIKIALYLKVEGEVSGKALFLMSTKSGEFIVKTLMGGKEGLDLFHDEMACSAIKEIGNILVSSFLVALTNFSGVQMQSSVPALSIDMLGAMLQGIFLDSEDVGEDILVLDTEFSGISAIEGIFMFIPNGDSLKKLLGAFGL